MILVHLFILICLYQVHAWDSEEPSKIKYNLKEADAHFEKFIKRFGKKYETVEEYNKRFEIFKQNLKNVNEVNDHTGSELYGITQFFDLTHEEFVQQYTGFRGRDLPNATMFLDFDELKAPDSWDWRQQGVVTDVKDQGPCGSCWCFSAVGCVEGQYAKKYRKLVVLSEQQALDCTPDSHGCDGGWPHHAFQSQAKLGGWASEVAYPYIHRQGQCQYKANNAAVKIIDGEQSKVPSEEQLKELLYSYGPISIAITTGFFFEKYRGGVATPEWMGCKPYDFPNHAVLLVGYGTENGVPYWLIKNSHGKVWGEQGYLKLQRGVKACNILAYVGMASIL